MPMVQCTMTTYLQYNIYYCIKIQDIEHKNASEIFISLHLYVIVSIFIGFGKKSLRGKRRYCPHTRDMIVWAEANILDWFLNLLCFGPGVRYEGRCTHYSALANTDCEFLGLDVSLGLQPELSEASGIQNITFLTPKNIDIFMTIFINHIERQPTRMTATVCFCLADLMMEAVSLHAPRFISYPSHWKHGARRRWASEAVFTWNSSSSGFDPPWSTECYVKTPYYKGKCKILHPFNC